MVDENVYPYIVFKLDEELYCISSKYVATLMQLPKFNVLPDSPPFIAGTFSYRGRIIEMFDLRVAFGLPSLQKEYQNFADMIDHRRQDHVNWVDELDRCVETGKKFTLATDPHSCAFGKWYDNYHSDNNLVSFHMKKIDNPHKMLHHAALEVEQCEQQCDACLREACLKTIMDRVKSETMPTILGLLDEAKDIFRSTVYHEMALVLNDCGLAITVDEVLLVEKLLDLEEQNSSTMPYTPLYISGVKRSDTYSSLIFEIDIAQVINKVKEYSDAQIQAPSNAMI